MSAQARFGVDGRSDMDHFARHTRGAWWVLDDDAMMVSGPYATRQESQAAAYALGVEWVDHETATAFAGYVAALSDPASDLAAAWSAWTLVPA